MGFWIFMLVMELLLPVLMIGFGMLFYKNPPKKINSIYGYRTKMSSLNMETWNYAHYYFGKLWLRMGCWMLPVVALVMLPVFGKDENVVGMYGSIIMTVQVIMLILPIVLTERELHRRFDADGKRRTGDGQ